MDMLRVRGRTPYLWVAVIILGLAFALAVSSLPRLGPTYDEQGFIVRGLGYVRGENQHMRVGHPLGLNALNALLLRYDEKVQLPTDDPAWTETGFHRPGELFLWEIGNNVRYVMFLARLPTIWLGVLLAALAARWAGELVVTRRRGDVVMGGRAGRDGAALLALALVALDPNILAHTRLATTDLGLAALAFLAGYGLYRFWRWPTWTQAVLAGMTFGLLQNSKFTAGLFVPLFGLVILLNSVWLMQAKGWRPPVWRRMMGYWLKLAAAYLLIAPLTLWAAYGFQIGTLPDTLPTFPQLSGLTLPLAHHLEQLLDIGGRLQKATPSFLMGQYSDTGWWTYFPVAFLLKTPLPTLILLLLAIIWRLRPDNFRKPATSIPAVRFTETVLLIPAIGYFAFALTTDINLGYRHLLPVLPFLFVFIAVTLGEPLARFRSISRVALPVALLMLWLLLIALRIHPYYLAYFNPLAGGSDGGWRYLVDSNLDWGQDLGNLADWLAHNGVDHVWLSYFGQGRPEYYGIAYTGLDSWPPRLMNPKARPFYPHDPAPGLYAISATNLQGVHFANHDQFAWFREREPIANVGYSIFLYQVEPNGSPVDLLLGHLQMDEIAPEHFALLGTNQVVPHWFTPGQSWLQPAAAASWLLLPPAEFTNLGPAISPSDLALVVETPAYALYRYTPAPTPPLPPLAQFTQGTDNITLQATNWEAGHTWVTGETIRFYTVWHSQARPQPRQIFVHLTDAQGEIISQWDGLDVAWEGWREGDTLWQKHQLTLPTEAPPGPYQLRVGLYHPETWQRWLLPDGRDFFILAE